MNDFRRVRKLFKDTITRITSEEALSHELREAAFPAYAHRNPFIDFVFWKRLEVVYNLLTSPGHVLDFGCGSGVMAYALAEKGLKVTAVDIEFGPLNTIRSRIVFPADIRFCNDRLKNLQLALRSFDFVIALDVLEHINDLDEILGLFAGLLKDDGLLIVSGPTENVLYKLGRRVAGKEFPGDYHVSDISSVKRRMERYYRITETKKLVWPFVLFEIIGARLIV